MRKETKDIIEFSEYMEEIVKEINKIVEDENSLLEDHEISRENLYDDIKMSLEERVIKLIEKEILSF